ncbi:MAG: glycosyl hydrolase family 18 protein [Acidimicrobiia bacterium]
MTADVTTDAPDQPTETPTDAVFQRRRRTVLLASAAIVVVAVVGTALSLRPGDDEPRPTALPVEAWVPYWALEDSLTDLSTRAGSFRELSPFWFSATGASTIEVDEHAPADLTDRFMSIARDSDVPIVPSISDEMAAGEMAGVLADPTTRATHIDALVTFARDGDYAGLDLDYERFAFADDKATWSTTRPNWVTFITELAERLHADGRTLTVSIPPVYDDGRTEESGYWVYDYGAIAPVVDRIRVMAYDYSTSTPGPVSPLPWVEQVIAGVTEASGMPEKLVLGIPLYGYNWPATTLGECPPSEEIGRTSVTMRSVDDLVQRRAAVPVHDVPTGEWTFVYDLVIDDGTIACTQKREVWYVDQAGARTRIQMALEAGFGGVSLWALGYDDVRLWDQIVPLLTPATTTTAPG